MEPNVDEKVVKRKDAETSTNSNSKREDVKGIVQKESEKAQMNEASKNFLTESDKREQPLQDVGDQKVAADDYISYYDDAA